LRAHGIDRRRVSIVSRRELADADTDSLHVVSHERRAATQLLEELCRRVYPAAHGIELHPNIFGGPVITQALAEPLGVRGLSAENLQQAKPAVQRRTRSGKSANRELAHANTRLGAAPRVHALHHAAAAASREAFNPRRRGAGETDRREQLLGRQPHRDPRRDRRADRSHDRGNVKTPLRRFGAQRKADADMAS